MTFPSFDFHAHGGITGDGLRSFLVHCARNNVSDIFLQGEDRLLWICTAAKFAPASFALSHRS